MTKYSSKSDFRHLYVIFLRCAGFPCSIIILLFSSVASYRSMMKACPMNGYRAPCTAGPHTEERLYVSRRAREHCVSVLYVRRILSSQFRSSKMDICVVAQNPPSRNSRYVDNKHRNRQRGLTDRYTADVLTGRQAGGQSHAGIKN